MAASRPPPISEAVAVVPVQQSAASRVFAIPELLEEILLLVTSDRPADPTGWEIYHDHHNCMALFATQRVSKNFQDTIQGSAKLRRHMYLEPQDENPDSSYPGDHRPLIYLCRRIEQGVWREWVWSTPPMLKDDSELEYPYGDNVPTMSLYVWDAYPEGEGGSLVEDLDSAFSQNWERPEASWRNIKISNSMEAKPVRISISAQVTPTNKVARAMWLLSGDTDFAQVFELVRGFLEVVDQQRSLWEDVGRAFELNTVDLINAKSGITTAECQ